MDGDGFLDSVLDRTLYFASEMPQAFTFDTICRAYEKVGYYLTFILSTISSHCEEFVLKSSCTILIEKRVVDKFDLVMGRQKSSDFI